MVDSPICRTEVRTINGGGLLPFALSFAEEVTLFMKASFDNSEGGMPMYMTFEQLMLLSMFVLALIDLIANHKKK